jgi:plasmid stabilization system protein ParE
MFEIEFHLQAEAEMLDAAAYYEERATGLGSDFLNDVERGAHRIQHFPYSWVTYEGEYRRYLLQRFPYGLIYRVASEKIYIVAVAHLRRRPGYWKTRE